MEKKCKIIYLNNFIYILSDDEIKGGDWCYDKSNNRIVQVIYKHKDTKSHYFVSANVNTKNEILKKGYSIELEELKKIIATTDTSLTKDIKMLCKSCKGSGGGFSPKCTTCKGSGIKIEKDFLPQPSQQFIEKYIESYNKGKIITDVLVEYNSEYIQTYPRSGRDCGGNEKYEFIETLKINSKDNTITIKELKNSWNREEHISNLIKYRVDYVEFVKSSYFQPNEKEINIWSTKWIEENL